MKDLLNKLIEDSQNISFEFKKERKAFCNEVDKYSGLNPKNRIFYGMNPLRKIDDYIKRNIFENKYENKIEFAKKQFERFSSLEKVSLEYMEKVKEETRDYINFYTEKELEMQKEEVKFVELKEDYEQKRKNFLEEREKNPNLFGSLYNRFNIKNFRKSRSTKQLECNSNLQYNRIKYEYKGAKKQFNNYKKYMDESFKNLQFLRERINSLTRENFKIKRFIEEIPLNKIFYKDYLISTKPLKQLS